MTDSPASAPQPDSELVVRTVAMPVDANANGDIFGGWLVSQMDLGGAISARRLARGRVTTVAIDGMAFLQPVAVGDTVSCYARLLRLGRTSMRICIEAWVQHYTDDTQVRVTSGTFTYVAINDQGRPRPVKG